MIVFELTAIQATLCVLGEVRAFCLLYGEFELTGSLFVTKLKPTTSNFKILIQGVPKKRLPFKLARLLLA